MESNSKDLKRSFSSVNKPDGFDKNGLDVLDGLVVWLLEGRVEDDADEDEVEA